MNLKSEKMIHLNQVLHNVNRKSLIIKMVIGAALGFVLISLMVFSVKNPKPEWGELWMIRPLIIVPLAGTAGSLFFSSIEILRPQSIWTKILLIIASAFAFIVAMWIGIILGLDGTLWN